MVMSNEIRPKTEMTKANPYNDIKLLFCVIISVLFNFVKKNVIKQIKKKYKFKYGLICSTTKVCRPSEADWEA